MNTQLLVKDERRILQVRPESLLEALSMAGLVENYGISEVLSRAPIGIKVESILDIVEIPTKNRYIVRFKTAVVNAVLLGAIPDALHFPIQIAQDYRLLYPSGREVLRHYALQTAFIYYTIIYLIFKVIVWAAPSFLWERIGSITAVTQDCGMDCAKGKFGASFNSVFLVLYILVVISYPVLHFRILRKRQTHAMIIRLLSAEAVIVVISGIVMFFIYLRRASLLDSIATLMALFR
ncbi:MAG: hypothetical protein NDJ90_00965 [Oligoflexia bacterium]|nr:hypothetical protein [Oligoflexia bacterium]